MKCLDRLQLEAANLKYDPSVVRCLLHEADRGSADVAADQCLLPARRDDLTRKRCSGRLAVRAGDGDNLPFQVAGRQLNFADHGDSRLPRLLQLRDVGWHAWADDNQLLLFEGALAVIARLDSDAAVK